MTKDFDEKRWLQLMIDTPLQFIDVDSGGSVQDIPVSIFMTIDEFEEGYKNIGKTALDSIRPYKSILSKEMYERVCDLDNKTEYQHIFRNGVSTQSLETASMIAKGKVEKSIQVADTGLMLGHSLGQLQSSHYDKVMAMYAAVSMARPTDWTIKARQKKMADCFKHEITEEDFEQIKYPYGR